MTRQQRRISWRPLLPAIGERGQRRLQGIYSSRQLQDLILYEKSRSDRRDTTVSLVVFDVSTLKRHQREDLIHELLRAVRTTDHIGWFGHDAVAVVLPSTTRDGAKVFLEHTQELAWPACVPVSLYSYPDRWIENAEDGNGASAGSTPGADGNNGNRRNAEIVTWALRVDFVRDVPGWKRALDIGGASLGLIVLSPLLILTAIVIKIVSPGPVFFRQTRVGLAQKPFSVLKFRTMHHNNAVTSHADYTRGLIGSEKPMNKLDAADPRIIFGGRVLRALAIDELPQLINVLKGEMSLVGPRPCLPYEAEEYHRWHTHRFSVLPGLSGLWQVSGKNNLTFAQMIRLDVEYEKRLSFWLDVQIILRTPLTIVDQAVAAVRHKAARAATEAAQKSSAVPALSGGSHGPRFDGCKE